MKIYQINVVCGYGSTGRIVVDLYNTIRLNGGECRVAYGRKKNLASGINSIKVDSGIEVLSHVVLSRLTGRNGSYSAGATRKLIKDIEKYKPDIIHLHNIHGYYLNYNILFSFLKGYNRPVIWTMHDCWAFTGNCAYYEGANCDGWRNGCTSCTVSYKYPKAYTNCNTSTNYLQKKRAFIIPQLTIVTPSNWLKGQLSQSFFSGIPCTVINNGIDLNVFRFLASDRKRKLGIADKKMILGVASIWTKNKGLNDLVEVSRQVPSQYVVCMVGLNKKQIKNLSSNIIGIERTENLEELAEYYSAADVFLNLTYEDTFPTTNIEALACGTPVITYRTGGSPEILSGACGWVVAKGDLDAVVNIIVNEMQEKGTYSAECLQRAKMFRREVRYQQYLELYSKIMGD